MVSPAAVVTVTVTSGAGVARSLPQEHGRRDGSGVPLSQAVEAVGPAMAWTDGPEN